MPILIGSPALNGGDAGVVIPPTDARGFARISNEAPDLGAFESLGLNFGQFVDGDGDGIADDWELLYGLNPNDPSDALLDHDGDGQNAAGEFALRTNPNDRVSSANLSGEIVPPSPTPSGLLAALTAPEFDSVVLEWNSVPGVVYSTWRSTDVVEWIPVEGGKIIAVESFSRFVFSAISDVREFYQLRVGAAPGVGEPRPPSNYVDPFTPITNCNPDTITGNPWLSGIASIPLHYVGTPIIVSGGTPKGHDAFSLDSGGFENVDTALGGTRSFTTAIAFKLKSYNQLIASASGDALNWELRATDLDQMRFRLFENVAGADASVDIDLATQTYLGEWLVAVIGWEASEGAPGSSMGMWLFDNDGALVGSTGLVDPNIVAATTNHFQGPLDRGHLQIHSFQRDLAVLRQYNTQSGEQRARQLSERLVNAYLNDAEPE